MKLSNLFQLMEGREDVLFAKYEQKIEQQLAHNGEKIETRRAFDQLFRAVGPKVADWAIRQYLKGQFRIEDAGRVNADILQYQKLSRRLPVEERDINKFDYRYIVNKLDELNKPEIRTDAPDEDGVKVLYKGPYGFLCEILTKEASIRLGKGTKWCTAAKSQNMFDYYHDLGPLYMYQNSRGHKFQFQFESHQFMDRKDQPLTLKDLNVMINDVPVIRELFLVKLKHVFQHTRNPIPSDWGKLHVNDPLAKVIQQALNEQHMHVLRIDKLKKDFPFLALDNVATYEYLHDDDEFIVNLFRLPKDEQYTVLKNIEHDGALRKRVIDGLTFNADGKGTHVDAFRITLADQFYENIITIQSPAFLRDVQRHNYVPHEHSDVRTQLVHNVLYQAMVSEGGDQGHFTPSQIEYGLRLVEALQGTETIKSIAKTLAVRGFANRHAITDGAKKILLDQCQPKIKPALNAQLSGLPLDRYSFQRLLTQAENGNLSPGETLAAHHVLQVEDLEVRSFAEKYVKKLQTATEAQKEVLYPTLIIETIFAIDDIVLNGKGELPPYAHWLIESKAAPFYEIIENKLSDAVNDGLYSFIDMVEAEEKTVDEIVAELTARYSKHGLAWYINTPVWKQFVTDLTNGGHEE